MGWSNNSVFQVLIVTGGGGGLFVYSGQPALGNPPVFAVVAPGVTHDPLGNAVVSILTAGNLAGAFTQIDGSGDILMYNAAGSQVIVVNPVKQAMFFYNPAAGPGNLVYSISPAAAGTDAFGNAYLPGAVAYKKILSTDFQAVQVNAGGLNWWNAGAFSGPWALIQELQLQADEVGLVLASLLNSNSVVFNETAAAMEVQGLVEILSGGLSWLGGATGDQLTVSNSGGNPLIQVTQLTGASTPLVRLQLPNVAAAALGIGLLVVGDTNSRLILDADASNNPRVRFGSGSAAPDCLLFRDAGGNQLNLQGADLDITSVGRGLKIAEGTNARMGVATLAAGTKTVNNNTVTGSTRIFLSCQSRGGTQGFLDISSIVVGTSFTIRSSNAADTSTVAWLLVEPG